MFSSNLLNLKFCRSFTLLSNLKFSSDSFVGSLQRIEALEGVSPIYSNPWYSFNIFVFRLYSNTGDIECVIHTRYRSGVANKVWLFCKIRPRVSSQVSQRLNTIHRKNCECCPVSLLIVRSQRLSWIQILNCHHCPKCHKWWQ